MLVAFRRTRGLLLQYKYNHGRQHALHRVVQGARRAAVVVRRRAQSMDTLLDTLLETALRDTNPAGK